MKEQRNAEDGAQLPEGKVYTYKSRGSSHGRCSRWINGGGGEMVKKGAGDSEIQKPMPATSQIHLDSIEISLRGCLI